MDFELDPKLERELDLTGMRDLMPHEKWYDEDLRQLDEDIDALMDLLLALYKHRVAQGMTQAQVAKAMKTTQSAVSEMESLSATPQIDTLQRYARAIGMKLVLQAKPAKPAARRKSA